VRRDTPAALAAAAAADASPAAAEAAAAADAAFPLPGHTGKSISIKSCTPKCVILCRTALYLEVYENRFKEIRPAINANDKCHECAGDFRN
jgi:hypothetical protein